MNAFEHSLRNAQRNIASLVAWAPFSDHKHARLVLEKLTNLISAQIPHLSDFRNGVVPFGGYRSDDADGSSRGLKKRFFRAVLLVICHRLSPAWCIYIALGELRCKRKSGAVRRLGDV